MCARRTANSLKYISGMPLTKDLGTYLGIALIHGRVKRNHFNLIIDKLLKKLSGWKANTLSLAGRAILVQSVASAIPNYAMQVLKFPAHICDRVDRLNINSLWGDSSEKKKFTFYNRKRSQNQNIWVAWGSVLLEIATML